MFGEGPRIVDTPRMAVLMRVGAIIPRAERLRGGTSANAMVENNVVPRGVWRRWPCGVMVVCIIKGYVCISVISDPIVRGTSATALVKTPGLVEYIKYG